MRPFTIEIPEEQIDDLKRRLRYSRLPGVIFQVDSQDGISLPFMRRLIDYWRDGFDWRAQEARLNQLPHFMADGHFAALEQPQALAEDIRAAFRPLRDAITQKH